MNYYDYASDSEEDPDNYPIQLWMYRKEEDVTVVKIPSAMVREGLTRNLLTSFVGEMLLII